MLTNPRDALRGQGHQTYCNIPYVRYFFLLCNSNLVFKMHRFSDIRLQKNVMTLKSGSEVTQGH